ncbi:putative bifunctional diguanylate cyclase/phosphodiesterase [Solicola sp. PLA-1-18]|uniref:putative bifunctional diguanylate cyclase/phosphodiesterase n=1 Tax=Solicola sp. PLA-1-18 TaxID=3380532 RepID=UPI003B79EC29
MGHARGLPDRRQRDSKTGLLTVEALESRLSETVALHDVAALWIDLDGFAEINGRYGRRAGDGALVEVAERLRHAARRGDLVGRTAGDEFVVALVDAPARPELERAVSRLRDSIRAPMLVGGQQVQLTATVGVATSTAGAMSIEDLLQQADAAKSAAKLEGFDRHAFFDPDVEEAAVVRGRGRQRLAVALRDRAFRLDYQPIVDVATGGTAVVEALLRGQRDGEDVVAEDFIAIAEDTGQVRALGQLAMELVTHDMLRLDQSVTTAGMRVALNLSPSELGERDFVDRLLAWEVPGGYERLVVEVTESVSLEKGSRGYDTLLLLRRLGATVSIDDFGTGYSSLGILDSLQPALIKIDRSLLVRGRAGHRSRDLLAATVQMIHALGARAVLEGVETPGDEQLATELGVDLLQGYGVAEPMPVDDLAAWVVQHPSE